MIVMEHFVARDPRRTDEVIASLRSAWLSAPHLRFGQLVTEAAAIGNLDVMGSEDHRWLAAFDLQAEKHRELAERRKP